ncbi:CDP-alcohol phosphatidyltransferase family protein [Schaalia suimastitidis]|uniref:CDP-alcohol phosphatidyltransferase family protein n=1 Tax=Schaalia suimastitidis TaxID=121163 RepID=UPI00047EF0D7|nr:CDP-alcohol phosphatidyltransferase family protein [Schaalia suimastitidis]
MSTAPSWGARFGAYRRQLDQAQKPGDGVPAYTRWVNRRGARLVAAAGAASGWSPNHVTALSFLLSLSGMVFLVVLPHTWWSGLPVGTLLALGYLFDSADGQLARLTGASSKTGEWIDHVVDAFRSPAIHLTLAVSVMIHAPHLWWFAIVALAYALVTSGQFLSQILAEAFVKGAGRAQRRGKTLTSFLLLPTDPGTLCWSFALWGLTNIFVPVYAVLAVLAVAHCALSLSRRYKDLRNLDQAARGADK